MDVVAIRKAAADIKGCADKPVLIQAAQSPPPKGHWQAPNQAGGHEWFGAPPGSVDATPMRSASIAA